MEKNWTTIKLFFQSFHIIIKIPLKPEFIFFSSTPFWETAATTLVQLIYVGCINFRGAGLKRRLFNDGKKNR